MAGKYGMSYNLERRQSPRKRFQNLLYVELEPANGGMVLNFSEHGFGFRAVKRVRPNQEVKFAFNLDDKRRLEGKGRLEWTDKDGRVAGMQFTDVSDEFRSEMRAWLSTASEIGGRLPKRPGPVPQGPGKHPASDPTMASRRIEALARVASAKAVRPISANPANSFPPLPDLKPEMLAPEGPHQEEPNQLPWGVFPPALGSERKPSFPSGEPSQPVEMAGNAVMKPAAIEAEPLDVPEAPEMQEEPQPERIAEPTRHASTVTPFVPTNPVAAIEARTADALNKHAQALLQHFQHEQERLINGFRESAARVLRESERQLFPIREAVQAQMKSLESSVAAANASGKVLDQYPALLERAQQQALDRFQLQMQEVLHSHVIELRRRTDMLIEDADTRVRTSALFPRRIRTSSGIIGTALIVLLLALVFTFRREVAGAVIWMGEQMSESSSPARPPQNETSPAANPPATNSNPTSPNTPAANSANSDAKFKDEPSKAPEASVPSEKPKPPRDVHTMWNDVAKGDVDTMMTLGTMYFTGQGVTKNCSQARRLFSAAARKGSEEAKRKLAEMDNGACG